MLEQKGRGQTRPAHGGRVVGGTTGRQAVARGERVRGGRGARRRQAGVRVQHAPQLRRVVHVQDFPARPVRATAPETHAQRVHGGLRAGTVETIVAKRHVRVSADATRGRQKRGRRRDRAEAGRGRFELRHDRFVE